MLTSEEWVADDHAGGPSLLFLGGFDREEQARDASQPTTALVLSYPIETPDQLRDQLGTIDLDRRESDMRRRAHVIESK
jgi:hypothetical protein